jgi:hypothetical protein
MERHPTPHRLNLADHDNVPMRLSSELKLPLEFRGRVLMANPRIAVNCYFYINSNLIKVLADGRCGNGIFSL